MTGFRSAARKSNRAKVPVQLQLERWQVDALRRLSAETRVPVAAIVRELLRGPLVEACLDRIGGHAEAAAGRGDG